MKKIIGSAAVISALFLLGGCGANTNSQNGAANNPPSTPGSMPTAMPATPPPTTSDSQPAPANTANVNTVMIQGFAFSPATLTVKKGTTVTWTNNDSVDHQIKSDTFNSSPFGKGQSFSFTFNNTGTFSYICAIHPSMTGTIIVQ